MARLYGERVPAPEFEQLLGRLRTKETWEARLAVGTVTRSGKAGRFATSQSADVVLDAVVDELCHWDDLDAASPALANLRDRLTAAAGLSPR